MKWTSSAFVLVIMVVGLMALVGPARTTAAAAAQPAPPGLLDGTAWWIELGAKGEQPMPDLLAFGRGLFDSRGCHEFGFGPVTYQATKTGQTVKFAATTKSEKQGSMAWAGEVKAEKISGTMKWTPPQGAAKDYTFSGAKHKPSGALDGTTWKAQLTEKDGKATPDTMSFAKGMLDSTAGKALGFRAGAYMTTKKGDETMFRAYTPNQKGGVMMWLGTVKAGKLTATATWYPKTGPTKQYTVTGTKQ